MIEQIDRIKLPITIKSIVLAASVGALAACADPVVRAHVIPEAEDHHTGLADTEEKATYFMRPGAPVPKTADLSRGDVPRDTYGRPYAYDYLGQTLPAFEGELADGGSFSSAELSGKWSVIEVWGIWCHDSRRDVPYASALSRALDQNPSIDFLSIHTPQNAKTAHKALKSYPSVSAWFDEQDFRVPTIVDTDASLRDILAIRWTPSYLLIAPDLSVQGFRTGLADADGEPVKGFVRAIAEVQGTWQASQED